MNPIFRTTLIALGFAGALALSPLGCGSDDPAHVSDGGVTDGSNSTSSLPDAKPTPDLAVVKISDNAVAGVLTEANTAEVMAGNIAVKSGQDARVKAFAMQMVTEHTTANTRLMALLPKLGAGNGDSPLRQMVSTTANVALTQIAVAPAASFDATYMASQVDMHKLVLQMLDEILIPSAMNAELKAELTTTRTAVMMHLSAAQTLAGSLGTPDGGA